MSMDRLDKAARAAGFAMAAPDEDSVDTTYVTGGETVGRAIVPLKAQAAQKGTLDAVWAMTGWMRSVMPSFGGRAPA